jgi:hypothetical protein
MKGQKKLAAGNSRDEELSQSFMPVKKGFQPVHTRRLIDDSCQTNDAESYHRKNDSSDH